ncbi:MAG: hypothetical protein GY822_30565 [Deltaproteobacteria bacterium]|nr:hypothetical protein [Deltaproteobacteria bacterium]
MLDLDSPAARAAILAEDARTGAVLSTAGMVGMMTVGTGLMFSSFVPLFLAFGENPETVSEAPLIATMGLLLGGALVMLASLAVLPFASIFAREETREKDTALLTYDMSLRARLGLPKKGSESRASTPIAFDDEEFE